MSPDRSDSTNVQSDSAFVKRIKKLCSEVSDRIEYPYEVFSWQLSDVNEISVRDFLEMTNHLKQVSIEECIGENVNSLIEQILQNHFDSEIIKQYIEERDRLLEDFCGYFQDIEFYKLEASSDRHDIRWLASTANEQEEFAVLIIDLPVILKYYNIEVKPIKAYCNFWYESSSKSNDEQYLFFSNLSQSFKIISLAFSSFGVRNSKSNKDEFINRVLNYSLGIERIPNEKKLLAVDEVERNRVDTEYIDVDGEECLIEITGENGYFLEVEVVGAECEIDLQDISENNRLKEIKRQVYSHIYTLNDFFHSVWSRSLCEVKSQHVSYRFSLSEKVTDNIYQLANLLVSKLENIRIYTVGQDLYFIGQINDKNWIVIHHIVPKYSLKY